jgi:hypothetical protein
MSSEVAEPRALTRMPESFVRMVGPFAYVWGCSMVSMINRRAALTSVPEPGLRGGGAAERAGRPGVQDDGLHLSGAALVRRDDEGRRLGERPDLPGPR